MFNTASSGFARAYCGDKSFSLGQCQLILCKTRFESSGLRPLPAACFGQLEQGLVRAQPCAEPGHQRSDVLGARPAFPDRRRAADGQRQSETRLGSTRLVTPCDSLKVQIDGFMVRMTVARMHGMNKKALTAVAALHQIKATSVHDEDVVADALRKAVEYFDYEDFSAIRSEFWLRHIALSIAVQRERLAVEKADREAASEILETRFVDRCLEDRRLSDSARQAFSRFCKLHDIKTLDLRGGGNNHGSPDVRTLDKEGQSVIDCSNQVQRRHLANGYIARKIGKALALIDALDSTPGRKPDLSFLDTKRLLDRALTRIQY